MGKKDEKDTPAFLDPKNELRALFAECWETFLTTGLVNAILGTASGPGNVGKNGALAIGGYIALSGLWAGPLTGASMNAARTLGPDIVRGDFSTTWIYVVATFVGGIIAVC